MKGILILEDGKKVSVDYDEKDFAVAKKKIGMERVEENKEYYYIDSAGLVFPYNDLKCKIDNERYRSANYYSDKKLCEADARSDTLMRRIRRYAREHSDSKMLNNDLVYIFYTFNNGLGISNHKTYITAFYNFGFDETTAIKIIERYKEDLLWYFEEYLPEYSGYYAE